MPPDLAAALAPFLARLGGLIDRDPALREQLAVLARAAADWLAPPAPGSVTPEPPLVQPPVAVEPAPVAPPEPQPVPTPAANGNGNGPSIYELASLLRFEAPPASPAVEPARDGPDLVPLPTLAARARLKAASARLVADRLAGRLESADEAVLARRAADLPNCYLWMLGRDPIVRSVKVWDDLAGAFEVAAAAADYLAKWEHAADAGGDRGWDEVLALAAEAQSILWYAVADAREVKQDFEQVQLYIRIKDEAEARRVYIRKYLKREDRSDPATWPDLLHRVGAAAERVKSVTDRVKARAKGLSKLKYQLGRTADPDGWRRAIELIDEVVSAGLPASSVELRDLVLPVFDRLADEPTLPLAVERVLREVERYQEAKPAAPAAPEAAEHLNPEVAEVANLLEGREVVLIGGQVRPDRRDALKRAFRLADVNWITSPEHTSLSLFEAPIARPGVAVVLLATRWSNHDYQNVKDFCEEYGKLFVKLPAGYHPNQVAYQVLAQAGERLRAAAG